MRFLTQLATTKDVVSLTCFHTILVLRIFERVLQITLRSMPMGMPQHRIYYDPMKRLQDVQCERLWKIGYINLATRWSLSEKMEIISLFLKKDSLLARDHDKKQRTQQSGKFL